MPSRRSSLARASGPIARAAAPATWASPIQARAMRPCSSWTTGYFLVRDDVGLARVPGPVRAEPDRAVPVDRAAFVVFFAPVPVVRARLGDLPL